MITDFETNTIYFSELLKQNFAETFNEIIEVLKKFKIIPHLLPKTKDIWARDYMPIQVSQKKFIEYRYDPDYLQGKYKGYRDLKTYPDIVCDSLGLKTQKSDIILDGGNIVKSNNCVILTDKVVVENRLSYSKYELIEHLKRIFEVENIVLIPQDKKDKFGHSDGMVRFIDNETVLVNYYYKTDSILLSRIKAAGLTPKFLEYKVKKKNKNNWAYINFLQTKDLILLPELGIDEDKEAFEQIEGYYSEYKGRIFQININDEVIRLGGALNCISWTIKE